MVLMTSSSWQEWTARLRAYVGWLNSQLRKEEGSSQPRRVSDLRNDLRDGVILAHLVAKLGGDTVPGIDPHPKNDTEAKENVERLFRFLIRKGVALQSITPKEVCEGDLKAIMRLVHAVASHYKPDTVLNPPKPYNRKGEVPRIPKKSCKVLPLQITSNLCPQRQNSKSEPTSLDSSYFLSESFIEQILEDVRQTKKQLILLQDTLLNGKLEKELSLSNSSLVRSERKNCTDSQNENVQDENLKLKKLIEEKEQEISRLKFSLSAQTKNFKYPFSVPARVQREELQVVAEALGSLRRCFPANDPQQHTLDTVEQSLAALLERINALEMAPPSALLKLKKLIEEKEQEISRLKFSLSAQTKNFKYPFSVPARVQREELQVVAEALGSLRRCFPANDPQQHTLDTVEQSLAALLERINALEMAPPSALMSSTLLRRSNGDKEAPHSLPTTLHYGEASDNYQEDYGGTKVVYYMDKSLTPFRCMLHKRIGEATLRDFKLLFDRPGQFRYHFKTLDPEFGMVKEEVLNDDDILPGWDSKIVAWIEEECS